MKLCFVAGTGAPSQSEGRYYNLFLEQLRAQIDIRFTTITHLGLGDVEAAAKTIGTEVLKGSRDQWIVVGHSQGGTIACLLSMLYPKEVVHVIALAPPLTGTTWTDPFNMPARAAIEWVKQSTGIELHPHLPHLHVPLPIVNGLRHHGSTTEAILTYLASQTEGAELDSVIGSHDKLVLPRRSAHPEEGELVHRYLASPLDWFRRRSHMPPNIMHLPTNGYIGHSGVVRHPDVIHFVNKRVAEFTHATAV